MTLKEFMGWEGPVTYRQHAAYVEWADEQWNRPDPTHHYLMRLCAVVQRGNVKKPSQVKEEHFRVKFSKDSRPRPRSERTKQTLADIAKQVWIGRVTATGSNVVNEFGEVIAHGRDRSRTSDGETHPGRRTVRRNS